MSTIDVGVAQWLCVLLGLVVGWLARWSYEATEHARRHRRRVGMRSVYLDDFDRRNDRC